MLATLSYYIGRVLQILGMWLLLMSIVMAGPLGPSARTFGVGVGIFVVGWLIVRQLNPQGKR